jgi:hypothetical protein
MNRQDNRGGDHGVGTIPNRTRALRRFRQNRQGQNKYGDELLTLLPLDAEVVVLGIISQSNTLPFVLFQAKARLSFFHSLIRIETPLNRLSRKKVDAEPGNGFGEKYVHLNDPAQTMNSILLAFGLP